MNEQALHEALLRPASYPERPKKVEFRETHVSRLYFAGDFVYKVKKPVDFGFLDFTTLQRRRFYCEEEVRLNRRFCPDTYLGVAEIRADGENASIGGPGATVEYAVRMRRLPAERMLDALIRRGDAFLAQEMIRLARRIAELHRQSEIAGNGGASLHTIRSNWRENFDQCRPFAGITLSQHALDLCRNRVDAFLARHAGLFRQREAEGFVREGHGDLHCEHVCLTDPIRIYDCIEFNRRFRVADTAADLAFLLMDLDHLGRRDLAQILLSAYARAAAPDDSLEILLPFYKTYRAWVRGKVESFLATEAGVSAQTREAAGQRAKAYFNLALGYLCRRPLLLLTCGLMGVGKSAAAGRLAERLGATLWRSDELRRQLTGRPAADRREAPFGAGSYTPEMNRATYDLLLRRTTASLAAGETTIADASFARREQRERFRQAAARLRIPCLILFMDCSEGTALARLDRRQALGSDASEGRRGLYHRQAAQFQFPEPFEAAIRVDTEGDLDYTVHLVLCALIDRTGIDS